MGKLDSVLPSDILAGGMLRVPIGYSVNLAHVTAMD